MNKIDISKKEKHIETEKRKLKKIFKIIYEDENKKKDNSKENLVLELIERASYMTIFLRECEREILDKGIIVEMQQGNYTIDRENPAIKTYTALIKSYQNVINQLLSLIPEEKASSLDEIGKEFLGGL